MIKVKKRKILLLPGDGIGPEVIEEVKKVINWLNKNTKDNLSLVPKNILKIVAAI